MRVLSRDPSVAKPGYAELDGQGTVLRVAHKWVEDWCSPRGHDGTPCNSWDIACTEGQWIFHDTDTDPNRLFKLAFDAGWGLAHIPAKRYMRIPPKEWRQTSQSKVVVQGRIARDLTPAERALFKGIPKGAHGDVLDAIGIGRAAIRLAAAGNRTFDIGPPK